MTIVLLFAYKLVFDLKAILFAPVRIVIGINA